jgi:signal transduction histidine kinase
LAEAIGEYQVLSEGIKDTDTTERFEVALENLSKLKVDKLLKNIPFAIDDILEGVERVAEIIKAMKVFSHIGPEEKTKADIRKSIESTFTVARSEWNCIAEAVTNFDSELPVVPYYVGDFNQALLNLIVNAANAIEDSLEGQEIRDKGVITVSVKQDGDWVEILISDTGTGIPEDVRPRIFEPFFTTKEVGKGSGQGLSLVYACIVSKHGGTIDFDTEMGKGTTFKIRLPLE